ncbi:MAG TPA: T9SS type A sorting domain-containing protein, partial [Chromatiaceae bacterium]|nr:T9SS type A sorting domain-containing protein [Chromatiaceae bacterium]
TGTPAAATFSNTATSETFGFVDAKIPGNLEGNSAPQLVDVAGVYHLFVGSEVGELWHYNNIDSNILGAFTRVNGVLDSLDEGEESIFAIANINDDEALEFLVGNKRGGLGLYTEFLVSGIHSVSLAQNSLAIFPNPTTSTIKIVFEDIINTEASIQITNLLGQIVTYKRLWIDQSAELDLFELPVGTYILTVETSKGLYVEKIIKKK